MIREKNEAGRRFPWTEQNSPSKNSVPPIVTGKWGTSKIPQKRLQTSSQMVKDPGTRVDTPKEIRRDEQSRSRWNDWRKFAGDLEPPPQRARQRKIWHLQKLQIHWETKKGDPQEWSGFSIIFPKYQCVSNTSCKTKQTQWEEANHDRHQEAYGRRSCWTHKSLPGLYLLSLPCQLGNRTRYSITGRLGRS